MLSLLPSDPKLPWSTKGSSSQQLFVDTVNIIPTSQVSSEAKTLCALTQWPALGLTEHCQLHSSMKEEGSRCCWFRSSAYYKLLT